LVQTDTFPAWHIARETQERLELINSVNRQYEITHEKYNQWERTFVGVKQLRPVHYARFTERWDWHGRLYTARYGHQALRKIERRTIEFNGCPCVELDYGGLHTRILYHLLGIDYRDDPYRLWGDATTEEQRLLAKTVVNAALNAKTERAAISACNEKMSTKTRKKKDADGKPKRKEGDELLKALILQRAYRKVGLKFKEVYQLALEHHRPIRRYIASDAGIWLMRIDSSIALDVLYHFAKQCIPCLGCHDSFIVPHHHEQELRETMNRVYFQRFGLLPIVK